MNPLISRYFQQEKFNPMMDYNQLMRFLLANKDKNFVQRILSPESYPYLDLGNGMRATHKMMWGEADNRYFVYPSIVQNAKKKLEWLDNRAAFQHAMKTGEYFQFSTPDSADWMSRHYKDVWKK